MSRGPAFLDPCPFPLRQFLQREGYEYVVTGFTSSGAAYSRVRKERERFFKECGSCGASTLYHVNA